MKQRCLIERAAFRVAAFVFFLNATFAFGACCLPVPSSENAVAATENAVAAKPNAVAAAVEMPCHHEEDSDSKSPHSDGHCLICVSMMVPPTLERETAPPTADYAIATRVIVVPGGFEPLFRPPISLNS
jgi:hypothetical protein